MTLIVRSHGLLLAFFALSGCRAAPLAQERGESGYGRFAVPLEVLPPRQWRFSCVGEPGRPLEVLGRWLETLGPRGVRRREPGLARLFGRWGVRDSPESTDSLLRWRPAEGGLEVQFACLDGVYDGFATPCLESLAFAMEANGVAAAGGPPSGCVLPEACPPVALSWREAIEAEYRGRGMVELRAEAGQGCHLKRFGPPAGPVAWVVFWDRLEGVEPSLEVSHVSVPFDAEGERDLLASILGRMGMELWPRH